MRQIWTVLQHDGPDHLGSWPCVQFKPHTDSGAGAGQSCSAIVGLGDYTGGQVSAQQSMQQLWNFLQNNGPNHLGHGLLGLGNFTGG